jgi:hypothetical protein
MKIKFLGVILILSLTSAVFGTEPGVAFKGISQMGMGGAGVAIVSNEHSLYLNPANLVNISLPGIKAPRMLVGINSEIATKYTDMMNLSSGSGTTDLISNLNSLVPLKIGAEIAASPLLAITNPSFGIGVFTSFSFTDTMSKSLKMKLSTLTDAGLYIGGARWFELFGKQVAGGLSLKYLQRVRTYNATGGLTYEWTMDDMLAFQNDETPPIDVFSGTGIGADVGFLTKIDTFLGSGNLGLVFNNVATTLQGKVYRIDSSSTAELEEKSLTLPMTATLGLGVKTGVPVVGKFLGEVDLAIDYQVVSSETSFFKKLNIGTEARILNESLRLRGGLNHGFIVGGFGWDFLIFKFDFAMNTFALGSEVNINPVTYYVFQGGILF